MAPSSNSKWCFFKHQVHFVVADHNCKNPTSVARGLVKITRLWQLQACFFNASTCRGTCGASFFGIPIGVLTARVDTG